MLMTGGRRLWPAPGLLWRSALVCAAMKSISPSAFIIGPMLAITIEGFILEAALRAFGNGVAGCLTGGALAMNWTFLQPFLRQLLFYGPDAALLYARGWRKIADWSGFAGASLWTPALALLAANAVLGAAAATAGMRLGKQEDAVGIMPMPRPLADRLDSSAEEVVGRRHDPSLNDHAPFLLVLHLGLIILAVFATRRLALPWLILGAAIYAGWGLSRKTLVLKRLRRPGIWAGILAAALLAGLLLGRPALGLRMGLRALLLTVGFACVSEELRHSALVVFLERHGGALFADTVRRAFKTFPGLLSSLPPGREIARRPVSSLRRMLAQAPALLDALDRAS